MHNYIQKGRKKGTLTNSKDLQVLFRVVKSNSIP